MKKIFSIDDDAVIHGLLDRLEYGTLALCDEGEPYSVPLNFVRLGKRLCFHGSPAGRKMRALARHPRGSFSAVEPYALIPSTFSSDGGLACPATQFFLSVTAEGPLALVEDLEEKAKILEGLMAKLQPEGGYRPLEEEIYRKSLEKTAVFCLQMERLGAKAKAGQNLSPERFGRIVEHLERRDGPRDRETLRLMRVLREESHG